MRSLDHETFKSKWNSTHFSRSSARYPKGGQTCFLTYRPPEHCQFSQCRASYLFVNAVRMASRCGRILRRENFSRSSRYASDAGYSDGERPGSGKTSALFERKHAARGGATALESGPYSRTPYTSSALRESRLRALIPTHASVEASRTLTTGA
ncbi:hypothetical protein Mapa_009813 [Marchantia paleacea]|nr:hypothetical protein Mapa_009813 [Marchantia paleacea]